MGPGPTRGCTSGEVACPDCLGGLPRALGRALVEPLKPSMDPDRALRRALAGELAELIGPTLLVDGVEIEATEAAGETITVTARVRWYDDEQSVSLHQTRWRRDGARLVLEAASR